MGALFLLAAELNPFSDLKSWYTDHNIHCVSIFLESIIFSICFHRIIDIHKQLLRSQVRCIWECIDERQKPYLYRGKILFSTPPPETYTR